MKLQDTHKNIDFPHVHTYTRNQMLKQLAGKRVWNKKNNDGRHHFRFNGNPDESKLG